MNILIVYAHPCRDSFTFSVKEALVEGLGSAGHTVVCSDLYAMHFCETMSEAEYRREGFYEASQPVPPDVLEEQRKWNAADAVAFVYPVFWTEAPAKLVGWFQRVWTYGFAYGAQPTIKPLSKALFLVTMGGSGSDPIRQEQVRAMQMVMLGDRIHDRAAEKRFVVFDEMTRGYGNDQNRKARAERFLQQTVSLGKTWFETR